MKSAIRYILSLSMVIALFTACSEPEGIERGEMAYMNLSVDQDLLTRATADIGTATHTVNRILVLPFQKVNQSLPDNQAGNFIPAWTFARQWDISSFPSSSLSLKLPVSMTYKVMVIGYNQNDYDFSNPAMASTRIILTNQPTPTTLANFRLTPKAPENVPELFVSYCIASQGSTVIGPVFTPQPGTTISLATTLKRFVSGLGVYVTDIPGYVKSVTLVAERMVKSIQVNDSLPVVVQTPGDLENRVIQKLVPAAGSVKFNVFLLPTRTTNKSMFYLDVEYDSVVERYQIKVPDSAVSQANGIILNPNGAVVISGSYSKINFGFEIRGVINLDDDAWDGIN